MHLYWFLFTFFAFGIAFSNVGCRSSISKNPNSEAVILGSSSASTHSDSGSVEIKCRIAGYDRGMGYLIGFYAENNYKVDSATIDPSGFLHFERDTLYPQGYYYLYLPDQKTIPFILGVDQIFSMEANRLKLPGSVNIEGNIESELLLNEKFLS